MADMNRGSRPLSPFMIGPYYRPQWTSMMSIAHRITGASLTVGAILVVYWLLSAAAGPEAYETADWVVTGFLGDIVMFLSLFALTFHSCNGIRHLLWDTGRMLEVGKIERSAQVTLAAAIVLTLIVWMF